MLRHIWWLMVSNLALLLIVFRVMAWQALQSTTQSPQLRMDTVLNCIFKKSLPFQGGKQAAKSQANSWPTSLDTPESKYK